jgi:uncharacterized paraquat-inducible protein A
MMRGWPDAPLSTVLQPSRPGSGPDGSTPQVAAAPGSVDREDDQLPRIGHPLERATGRSPSAAFAFARTNLALLAPTVVMPLMSVFKAAGSARMRPGSGVGEIWQQQWPIFAVVGVAVLPFLRFHLLTVLLGPVLLGCFGQQALAVDLRTRECDRPHRRRVGGRGR